jgi:hypothetical protein
MRRAGAPAVYSRRLPCLSDPCTSECTARRPVVLDHRCSSDTCFSCSLRFYLHHTVTARPLQDAQSSHSSYRLLAQVSWIAQSLTSGA